MTQPDHLRDGDSVADRLSNPAAELSGSGHSVPLIRLEHSEGLLTRMIEQQTARVPSHWFLLGALGSMGLSLALELRGEHRWSRFVGMWSHTLLIAGVYNKLVKTLGQD